MASIKGNAPKAPAAPSAPKPGAPKAPAAATAAKTAKPTKSPPVPAKGANAPKPPTAAKAPAAPAGKPKPPAAPSVAPKAQTASGGAESGVLTPILPAPPAPATAKGQTTRKTAASPRTTPSDPTAGTKTGAEVTAPLREALKNLDDGVSAETKAEQTRGRNRPAIDEKLMAYCNRINRLQEEKDARNEDQKEVIKEAKDAGFDGPSVRKAAKALRDQHDDAKRKKEELAEDYRNRVGIFG